MTRFVYSKVLLCANDDTPKSGSRVTLLTLRPLRTGLATFTASGSSLINAPFGTRFHYFQPF